ncbi:MAG TPA: hypothetical protein VFY72_03970, partial [Beijerinckiaceae bacterium]|nr:hypothetical protein [Beijerinckiaceae bacterium]
PLVFLGEIRVASRDRRRPGGPMLPPPGKFCRLLYRPLTTPPESASHALRLAIDHGRAFRSARSKRIMLNFLESITFTRLD